MGKYEKFDWKFMVELWSAATSNYLWNNHRKVLSEEEFVDGWCNLGRTNHSPGKAKKQYRRLKEKFGFFTGELA